MSLSTTIAEAKSSVDRLHNIVDKSYQEMTARLQALESRELDRMSHAQLTQCDKDSILSSDSIDTVRQSRVPRMLVTSGSDALELEYLEELKRSWVYRRNSAFRLSTFSIDRHSTTWSCLSSLSLSEVSNISVLNLAIRVEDVNNPQRLSQTWSNDQMGPRWPLLPHSSAPDPKFSSGQHEARQQILPQSARYDGETRSSMTRIKSPEDTYEESSTNEPTPQALGETTECRNARGPGSPESSLEQDAIAYKCKFCGEVSTI